ncbi:MAG TPA: mechanosensitive ion channel domain-containing protein [Gemmatimonadota bacterium]|nr:mechanosensitive ion channel domain-containing protein [Gemmatimonadota bacterium]
MSELFESPPQWVAAIPWGWIAALLLVIVGYFTYRVLARRIGDQVADAERRHRYRKRVRYAVGTMVLVVLIVLFIDRVRELGTLLGFVGAGVAIALREYLASVLAWFYIITQRSIALGSRIEIGSARGDVIDIGVFKLTLVEVRGDGLGEQSSGRLVTVPNYKVLIDPVYMLSSGAPYVWDEMDFLVTHESDWEQAREFIEQIGREVTAPQQAEVESGFRRLGDRYAFRPGITTPIVYVSIAESGINLKLRYLTHVRQRRTSRDEISRRVLRLFRERPEIEFGYPTTRSYRREIDLVRPEESPEDRPTPA